MSIRMEIRSLPWWVGALLVLAAVVVLVARIVGLLVLVTVDGLERAETAIATAAGVSPWGSRVLLLPTDVPVPGPTPGGRRD